MIEKLLDIYSEEIPAFLYEIADSPQMQRLKGIGMNCGCEYTSFPLFRGLEPYSRFTHSMGVGAIVWNFTHDPRQAIAGLLHDVASPAFAHVIDFMKGDYLVQESTEEKTAGIIASSAQICEVLALLGLPIDLVADYHIYPVADNDTPRLSADRLEYTMGNILNYRFGTLEDVARFYRNLVVAENEEGVEELCFSDRDIAEEFAHKALECGKVYVCDADRYSMQMLSEIVRAAIQRGAFAESLLYTTEKQVIAALTSDAQGKADWERFCRMNAIVCMDIEGNCAPACGGVAGAADVGADADGAGGAGASGGSGGDSYPVRVISAKKRCIDPFVAGKGRVSSLYPSFRKALDDFMGYSFDYGVCGRALEE